MNNRHKKERILVMKKGILLAITLLSLVGRSTAQDLKINVSDARFTAPLLEKLIKEYKKVDPDFQAQVLTHDGAESDARVSLDNEASATILGRYIVLPIANSQNVLLENKKVRKGLNGKLTKQIFVLKDYLEALDAEENGEKELPGTVYSLTGSKAITTKAFANALHVSPNKIKGKKIVGREENALTAVQNHNDAVSFNVASLVYDTQSKKPVSGLTVLPIDIDDNGKITEEERSAFGTITQLTEYIDHLSDISVPIGNIYFDTQNPKAAVFANWVSQNGQQLLHEYGYLRANTKLIAQK